MLKYHVDGVWNSLKKQAESITVPNLVLLRLCTDDYSGYWDVHERAGEIGLPTIEGFDARVLKIVRCPYIEEIKKALVEKKSFNYRWKDYSVKGYLKNDEFRAWFIVETEHSYYLLDGMHALWKER